MHREKEVTAWQVSAYLAVQTLDLVFAAVGQVLSRVVDGGEEQLGIGQQGVSPLQVSPQLLLHVEVSVAHLETDTIHLQASVIHVDRPLYTATVISHVAPLQRL